MLIISARRCDWCLNDECGIYWLDIYWYTILMSANIPEFRMACRWSHGNSLLWRAPIVRPRILAFRVRMCVFVWPCASAFGLRGMCLPRGQSCWAVYFVHGGQGAHPKLFKCFDLFLHKKGASIRANKPKIRIGGSVWCSTEVDHVIFVWQSRRVNASGLEVTLWCTTMSNGYWGSVRHALHMLIKLKWIKPPHKFCCWRKRGGG